MFVLNFIVSCLTWFVLDIFNPVHMYSGCVFAGNGGIKGEQGNLGNVYVFGFL